LSLDLRHLRNHVTYLVTIVGGSSNTMDIADLVGGFAQERFERRLAITATKQVTVGRDHQFDQPWRGPVGSENAAKDRLELVAPFTARNLRTQALRICDGPRIGALLGMTRLLVTRSPR